MAKGGGVKPPQTLDEFYARCVAVAADLLGAPVEVSRFVADGTLEQRRHDVLGTAAYMRDTSEVWLAIPMARRLEHLVTGRAFDYVGVDPAMRAQVVADTLTDVVSILHELIHAATPTPRGVFKRLANTRSSRAFDEGRAEVLAQYAREAFVKGLGLDKLMPELLTSQFYAAYPAEAGAFDALFSALEESTGLTPRELGNRMITVGALPDVLAAAARTFDERHRGAPVRSTVLISVGMRAFSKVASIKAGNYDEANAAGATAVRTLTEIISPVVHGPEADTGLS